MQTINDVVQWRLCVGCGACEYICPNDKIRLMDFLGEGIRPVADTDSCKDCQACLDVCPAVQSDFHFPAGNAASAAFEKEWGPITGIWEGHASDPEIRDKGSSGGALTALAAYCVEKLGMHGVLHTAQDPEDPILNRTRLSRTRTDLVAATGSRYSPGSVGNGLGLVESAPAPCAVIGKPAEIAAVWNARKLRPALDQKIGVTMSFFCAESPSTLGTEALLKKMGVDPATVRDLPLPQRFGWPGHFAPTRTGDSEPCGKMTYAESWAFLQRYRPWSVQLWPDGSGELADISCGDPWYEKPDGKNPGSSLVVARTVRGREIVEGAIAAGATCKASAGGELEAGKIAARPAGKKGRDLGAATRDAPARRAGDKISRTRPPSLLAAPPLRAKKIPRTFRDAPAGPCNGASIAGLRPPAMAVWHESPSNPRF